jgi:hypothetical protein
MNNINKIALMYIEAYNDDPEQLEDPTVFDESRGIFEAGKVASLLSIAEKYEEESEKSKKSDSESFEDED